jgi:arginine/lysine/ornithine decarboxylase
MEPLCGIAAQPTAASVAEALHKESCRAALLTSPNYYGLAAPLAAIAEAVHAHGALLLVDEAHGAHLGFSGKLPPSALSCGADAAAQSAHKLLGALTQASLLHLRGEGIDQEKVAQAMSLLTTTSPSHLLLASLDAACCQLAQAGAAMSDKALSLALYLREGLAGIAGLQVLDLPGYTLDRTKVTVNVAALNLTGFAAAAFLRQKKIAVELADAQNILYLITYADDKAAIDASIAALKELAAARRPAGGRRPSLPYPPLPETALLPREAFYQGREAVPLAQATGRVAAQEITFCPPGIPLLLPGERISQEIVEYIEEQARFHESDAWRYVSVVR